jgi:aminoglycoside phosphotransferase (APT) family kinase protein
LGIDIEPVSAWLTTNLAGAVGPFSFELIAGGHSNLTYRVTDAAGQAYVLRRPPLGALLASAHDMGREHRIIDAVRQTSVPVAPALGYCEDPAVNGAPFYVMGFVEGTVVRSEAEAEAALSLDQRAACSESLVSTLVALHAVDPDDIGLGTLGRKDGYIERQLKRWHAQWELSKTREIPSLDATHRRLSERVPAQQGTAIVHGDYRLDNCMTAADGTVAAVLDWEICTLGDPLADLGLLYVYWGMDGDNTALPTAPTTVPGFWGRDRVIEYYGDRSGRDLSAIDFYVAFGYWKLACIVEGVYARYLHGAMGDRDPSSLHGFVVQVDRCTELAAEYADRLS